MRNELLALALLAGCAAPAEPVAAPPPQRGPFSVDALFSNPTLYLANHYLRGEVPALLISDLTAAGFECLHSAAGSRCTHVRHASNCFFADSVDIDSALNVVTRSEPRCMGVLPPATTP